MNKFIKLTSEKIKLKIMENPYSSVLGIIVLLLIIPILIWITYYIGDSGYVVIHTSSTVDGLLGFYGSFLSFIGTIALGALALWQNIRFKDENDKSQVRLQELAIQANEISQDLMNLEKDKFRPYIRMDDTDMFLAISKDANGFGDEIEKKLSTNDINIRGYRNSDGVNYEQYPNPYYPECITFSFRIQNIGQATIAELFLKRLWFMDGVTGRVGGFRIPMDTSILNEQKKQISLIISSEVSCRHEEGNRIFDNQIYNFYSSKINDKIRVLGIEMGISYKDIYGREYNQEFTFHVEYDLDKENETELILKTRDVTIKHHIAESPYVAKEGS